MPVGARVAQSCQPERSVLPRAHRLTRPVDFSDTVRRGRRAKCSRVVLHYRTNDDFHPARVGFIVSKAIGGAVVRNRVKRRLRHLLSENLGQLPVGSHLVVRALPSAADASHAALRRDVDAGLTRLQRQSP